MLKNPITGETLPKNWKLLKVDDIKSTEKHACVTGPFGSDISSKYFVKKGIPVIRGNNLSLFNDKFKTEGFVFVSPKQANNYKGQHVKANDLVFTSWGTLGQVGIIPKNGPFEEYIISNKQLKLRVNEEIVNPTYLYYYFSSKAMVTYINNIAIGAAVPGINLGILKNLPVVLPPKDEQDLITESLEDFFNLIENNNQRIQLLEDMVEEVYKEWFVRMRFPGYQDCRYFDKDGKEVERGTDGALPDGWEDVKLLTLYKTSSGGTPSRKIKEYYKEGAINWVKTGELKEDFIFQTKEKITEYAIKNSSAKLFPKETVIIAMYGATIGRLGILAEPSTTNQACCAIIPKSKIFQYNYIFSYLKYYIEKIINLGMGAAQQNISQELIKDLKIKKPPEHLMNKFNNATLSFFELKKSLQQKNQLLQETRDLLLPRLISGKLSVADINVAV